jgi:hypothetical protein
MANDRRALPRPGFAHRPTAFGNHPSEGIAARRGTRRVGRGCPTKKGGRLQSPAAKFAKKAASRRGRGGRKNVLSEGRFPCLSRNFCAPCQAPFRAPVRQATATSNNTAHLRYPLDLRDGAKDRAAAMAPR